MSNVVDQYAVQMKFDNADFENKVSSTISALEKFKSSLASLGHDAAVPAVSTLSSTFSDMGTGIDDLTGAVQNVTGEFTAMDIVFAKTIANMTDQVEKFAAKMVNALTLEPVKLGFQEYETQVKATQVIKANTGKDIGEINAVLDEMNTYADKTIYNFTQMTDNLSKFVAQGVELDEAKEAIMGMANAAAMFGATPQDFARATYQMSQALGGVIRMQDWRSLKNANMATAKLKQTIIDTAVEMGKLESSTPDWGKMVKGATTFEASLESGWLTGDVFVEAMKKFNDTTTALGIEGQEAATHAKTFTQLRDATMEAVQSGWTRVWRTIIGDLDQAEEFWSKVNDSLNGEHGIITAYSDAIGKAFEDWAAGGGREKAIEALSDAFHGLLDVLAPVADAFAKFFPTLDGDKIMAFTDKVGEAAEKFHSFGTKFRSYFGNFVEKYDKEVKKWSETVWTDEEVYPDAGVVEQKMMEMVRSNPYYQGLFNSFMQMLKGDQFKDKDGNLSASKIKSYLGGENFKIFDRFTEGKGAPYKNSKTIEELAAYLAGANDKYINQYNINGVKNASHFNSGQYDADMYQLYRAILAQNGIDIDTQYETMRESLKTTQKVSKEIWHVDEQVKAVTVSASDVNEQVYGTELAAKNLYKIMKNFPNVLETITNFVGNIYTKLIKPITSNVVSNALQTGLQILGRIFSDLGGIADKIRELGIVDKLFDNLYNFFNRNFNIAGFFQTIYNTFINIRVTVKQVIDDLGTFFATISGSTLLKRFQAIGTVLFHTIRDILGNNVMTGGLIGSLIGVLQGAFVGFFKGGKGQKFGGLGGMIKGAFEGLFKGAFSGFKMGGLLQVINWISKGDFASSGIINFLRGLEETITRLFTAIENFNFEEFIRKARNAFDIFFDIMTKIGLKENGEFSITLFFTNFFKLAQAAISGFIKGLFGQENELGKATHSVFSMVQSVIHELFESFKNSKFGQTIINALIKVKNAIVGIVSLLGTIIYLGAILIGDVILPLTAAFADFLSHKLPDSDTVGEKLKEFVGWLAGTALPAIVTAFTTIATGISTVVTAVTNAYNGVKDKFFAHIEENPDGVLASLYDKFTKFKEDVIGVFTDVDKSFKDSALGGTLSALAGIFTSFWKALKTGFTGVEEATDEIDAVSQAAPYKDPNTGLAGFLTSIKRALEEFPNSETFKNVCDGLTKFGSILKHVGTDIWSITTKYIWPAIQFIVEWAPKILGGVFDAFVHGFQSVTELINKQFEEGWTLEGFVAGIIGDPAGAIDKAFNGITGGLGSLFDAVVGAFTGHEVQASTDEFKSLTQYTQDAEKYKAIVAEYKKAMTEAGYSENEINTELMRKAGYDAINGYHVGPLLDQIEELSKIADEATTKQEEVTTKVAESATKSSENVSKATTEATNSSEIFVSKMKEVMRSVLMAFNVDEVSADKVIETIISGFTKYLKTLGKLAENKSFRNLFLGAFGLFTLKQVTNRATKLWTGAFQKVSENSSGAVKSFGESIQKSNEALSKGIINIGKGALEELTGMVKMLSGAFTTLSNISKSVVRANNAEAFKDFSVGIFMLAAAFSAIALVIDHIGLDKWQVLATALAGIVGILAVGAIAMGFVSKFVKATTEAVQPITQLEDNIPGVIHSFLTTLGSSIQDFLKKTGTKNLLIGIAIAIGAMTASLIALSFIPGENLLKAGVALAGLAFGLKKLMEAAGGNGLGSGIGVAAIGFAVASLVKSMKTIAKLDAGALMGSVLTIGALLAELYLFINGATSKSKPENVAKQILQVGVAMAAIGIGVKALASAVKKIGSLDLPTIGKGLLGVGALLLEMSLFVNHTENTQMFIKTAIAMGVISVALNIMSIAVRNFGSIDFEKLLKGLAGVGALLGEISLFMSNTTWDAAVPLRSSIAILTLSVSMNILYNAVKNLGKIDLWTLVKGLGGVAVLMVGISDAVNTMQGSPVKFRSMLASAILLVEVYAALSLVKSYGEIDLGTLAKGVLSFIAIMWSIAGATKTLGGFSGSLLKSIVAMVFMLGSVAATLYLLTTSELDADRFVKFANGIAECILSIGVIYAVLGALKLDAASGLSAGTGLATFLASLVGVITIVVISVGAIGTIINGVASLLGAENFDVFNYIGGFFERLVGFLGELAGTLAGNAVKAFTETIGDGGQLETFGKTLEAFGGSIEKFKNSLSTLKGLSDKKISTGIENFTSAVTAITKAELRDAVSDLIHSWLVDGDESNTSALTDFGADLEGFGKGAKGFADYMNGLPTDLGSKADGIVQILESLTGVVPKSGSIFEAITGSQDFSEFGSKFASFGSKIKEFADNVGNLENSAAIGNISPFIGSIAELMGGTFAFDVSQLDALIERLPALGEAFGKYVSYINPLDREKAIASVTIVSSLAKLQSAVSEIDVGALSTASDFIGSFTGFGENFNTFMAQLSTAVSTVQTIQVADDKGNIKEKIANTTDILTIALDPIKEIQNLIDEFKKLDKDKEVLTEWFTGDTTLSRLGTQLSSFGTNYSKFLTTVAGLVKTITGEEYAMTLDELLTCVGQIITSLESFNGLQAQTGAFWKVFGKEVTSLDVFGENLAEFGGSLREFASSLMESDDNTKSINDILKGNGAVDNFKTLVGIAGDLITTFNGVEIPNQGSFLSKILFADKSLGSFGAGLKDIGSGLKELAAAGTEISDIGLIDTALAAVGKIFDFFRNNGPDEGVDTNFTRGIEFLSQFAFQLQSMLGVNSEALADSGPLGPIYDIFEEAGKQAIAAFTKGMELDNKYTLTNACQSVVDFANTGIMTYIDETVASSGAYFIEGIVKGMRDRLKETAFAATEAGQTILTAFDEILGINSPSKEGEYRGEMFDLGAADGIKKSSKAMSEAAVQAGEDMLTEFDNLMGIHSHSKEGDYRGEMFGLGVADGVSDTTSDVKDATKETGNEMLNGLNEALSGAAEAGKQAVNDVAEGMKSAADGVKESGVLDGVTEAFTGTFEDIKGSTSGFFEGIGKTISDAISPLTDKISESFDGLTGLFTGDDGFVSKLTSAWEDPTAALDKYSNDLVNSLGGVQDTVFGHENILDGVLNDVSSSFDKLGNDLGKQLGITTGDEVTEAMSDSINAAVGSIGGTGQKVYDSIDNMARRVISGEFGNGQDRINALESLGMSYGIIQNRVNEMLGCNYRYATSNEDLTRTLNALGDSTVDSNDALADHTDLVTDYTKEMNDALESVADSSAYDAIQDNLGKTLSADEKAIDSTAKSVENLKEGYKNFVEEIHGAPYEELVENGIVADASNIATLFEHGAAGDLKEELGDTSFEDLFSEWVNAPGDLDENLEAKKTELVQSITKSVVEVAEEAKNAVEVLPNDTSSENDWIYQDGVYGAQLNRALRYINKIHNGVYPSIEEIEQYKKDLQELTSDEQEFLANYISKTYGPSSPTFETDLVNATIERLEYGAKAIKDLIREGDIDEAFNVLSTFNNVLQTGSEALDTSIAPKSVDVGEKYIDEIGRMVDRYKVMEDLEGSFDVMSGKIYNARDNGDFAVFREDLRRLLNRMKGETTEYFDGQFIDDIEGIVDQLGNSDTAGAVDSLEKLQEELWFAVDRKADLYQDAQAWIDKAVTAFATGDYDKAGMYIGTGADVLLQQTEKLKEGYYGVVEVFGETTSESVDELAKLREQIDSTIEKGDLNAALAMARRYNDAIKTELEQNEIDVRSEKEKFAEKYQEIFAQGAADAVSCMSETSKETLEAAKEYFADYVNEFVENYGGEYKDAAGFLKDALSEIEKNNDWEAASEQLNKASDAMSVAAKEAAGEYRTASMELVLAYQENVNDNAEGTEKHLQAALSDMDEKVKMLDDFKTNQEKNTEAVSENAKKSSDAVKESTEEIVQDVTTASQNSSDAVKQAGTEIENTTQQAVDNSKTILDNSVPEFETSGGNLAEGLGLGYVNKMRDTVIPQFEEINKEIIESTKNTFGEASPSKVFKEIGAYCGEGMYIGVESYSDRVRSATLDMADGMILGAREAVRMANLANDTTLDLAPTITPVIDTTAIANDKIMAGFMADRPTFEFGSVNVKGIDQFRNLADAMADFTSDNSNVVAAIHQMRGDITSLGTSMENMKIVMDSGRLVGQISGGINQSLGTANVLRKRGVR